MIGHIAAKRILAVSDLGDAGVAAIRTAAERARTTNAALGVVHAMPRVDMVRPLFPQRLADDALVQASLPTRVATALRQQIDGATSDGSNVETFVETGGTAEVALDVAERWAADLLVVAASETGSIDVERIVRHAHVPVLVVRDGPAVGAIVACTDFSDPSLPAVSAAADEARSGDELFVVHALEPIPVVMMGIEGAIMADSRSHEDRTVDAERRLAEAVRHLEVPARCVVVDGGVSALVAVARERAARLLVIGTVGRSGISRFFLGSTAEALLRRAPCSTLIVRLHRGARAD